MSLVQERSSMNTIDECEKVLSNMYDPERKYLVILDSASTHDDAILLEVVRLDYTSYAYRTSATDGDGDWETGNIDDLLANLQSERTWWAKNPPATTDKDD
jgi:hypothetical protein